MSSLFIDSESPKGKMCFIRAKLSLNQNSKKSDEVKCRLNSEIKIENLSFERKFPRPQFFL